MSIFTLRPISVFSNGSQRDRLAPVRHVGASADYSSLRRTRRHLRIFRDVFYGQQELARERSRNYKSGRVRHGKTHHSKHHSPSKTPSKLQPFHKSNNTVQQPGMIAKPTATMMRAVQLKAAGPASNLRVVDLPIPVPKEDQVLIRVKSFGINRSEILTRQFGRAPVGPVQLPRVLGVEATGLVEAAPGHEQAFPKGAIAMTAVGGMGLVFDGGYAQYVCVSKDNVLLVDQSAAKLGWDVLGALPEMLQTAHGSLFRCLKLKAGDTLLIRGGTTSVGLAAAAIAKDSGARVIATTRRSDSETKRILLENGADEVIVDDGKALRERVLRIHPSGVDKVLDLVGGSSLPDSLSCLADEGVCCFTGLVGGSAAVADFNPLAMIQTGKYLTAYGERFFNASNFPLNDLVGRMVEGTLKIRLGKVFHMNDIAEAHEYVERNESIGKVVVMTGM
ncbi:hypothetical protein LTS07_004011 [Exophiala sideris]|uniref:Enoyl reductase (ER) domain-containing protein n=1 Tax=Exophiala sideris TaxID=1016849 RepID=A0ABR0JE90_9EURO|nr:hypothetical protein LTS07_004011 [Exophiala sideris]KAK5037219.1 hypothetical protein LTR13_005024 [Exophiala sideris]KAK5062126.1 hypothetical protein LTR69_004484 [Exophiala sideris]KAK5182377.1 hypothetical protein LTR44_005388 [Eurotiomycetes sp. CCFEE 6388]